MLKTMKEAPKADASSLMTKLHGGLPSPIEQSQVQAPSTASKNSDFSQCEVKDSICILNFKESIPTERSTVGLSTDSTECRNSPKTLLQVSEDGYDAGYVMESAAFSTACDANNVTVGSRVEGEENGGLLTEKFFDPAAASSPSASSDAHVAASCSFALQHTYGSSPSGCSPMAGGRLADFQVYTQEGMCIPHQQGFFPHAQVLLQPQSDAVPGINCGVKYQENSGSMDLEMGGEEESAADPRRLLRDHHSPQQDGCPLGAINMVEGVDSSGNVGISSSTVSKARSLRHQAKSFTRMSSPAGGRQQRQRKMRHLRVCGSGKRTEDADSACIKGSTSFYRSCLSLRTAEIVRRVMSEKHKIVWIDRADARSLMPLPTCEDEGLFMVWTDKGIDVIADAQHFIPSSFFPASSFPRERQSMRPFVILATSSLASLFDGVCKRSGTCVYARPKVVATRSYACGKRMRAALRVETPPLESSKWSGNTGNTSEGKVSQLPEQQEHYVTKRGKVVGEEYVFFRRRTDDDVGATLYNIHVAVRKIPRAISKNHFKFSHPVSEAAACAAVDEADSNSESETRRREEEGANTEKAAPVFLKPHAAQEAALQLLEKEREKFLSEHENRSGWRGWTFAEDNCDFDGIDEDLQLPVALAVELRVLLGCQQSIMAHRCNVSLANHRVMAALQRRCRVFLLSTEGDERIAELRPFGDISDGPDEAWQSHRQQSMRTQPAALGNRAGNKVLNVAKKQQVVETVTKVSEENSIGEYQDTEANDVQLENGNGEVANVQTIPKNEVNQVPASGCMNQIQFPVSGAIRAGKRGKLKCTSGIAGGVTEFLQHSAVPENDRKRRSGRLRKSVKNEGWPDRNQSAIETTTGICNMVMPCTKGESHNAADEDEDVHKYLITISGEVNAAQPNALESAPDDNAGKCNGENAQAAISDFGINSSCYSGASPNPLELEAAEDGTGTGCSECTVEALDISQLSPSSLYSPNASGLAPVLRLPEGCRVEYEFPTEFHGFVEVDRVRIASKEAICNALMKLKSYAEELQRPIDFSAINLAQNATNLYWNLSRFSPSGCVEKALHEVCPSCATKLKRRRAAIGAGEATVAARPNKQRAGSGGVSSATARSFLKKQNEVDAFFSFMQQEFDRRSESLRARRIELEKVDEGRKGRLPALVDADGAALINAFIDQGSGVFKRPFCHALETQRKCLYEHCLKKNLHSDLRIVRMPGKGRAVLAGEGIKKDDFVLEYKGELCSEREARERDMRYDRSKGLKGSFMFYFKHNLRNMSVDATEERFEFGPARLINHSRKNPNLKPKTVALDGDDLRLFFVASRDINEGEELLVDYGERDPEALKQNPWLND